MQATLPRKSSRKFSAQPISDYVIKELIESAMRAPSAGNQEPWHFIVIKDGQILDKIPGIHPHTDLIKGAPIAILVCGDEKKEKYKGFLHSDCSAAVENILIKVADKGIAAVWTGIHPLEDRIKEFRELLGIPKHIIPYALIHIGYKAEEKTDFVHYDESLVHYNSW